MKYILQIAKDGVGGADWSERHNSDTEQQLNLLVENVDLSDVKIIIKDLVDHISNSPFKSFYEKKLARLQSDSNYKVLVIGVGEHHGKDEISMVDVCENNVDEVAHVDVDRNPFDGPKRMNRLYVFDKKPKNVKFHNSYLQRNKLFENIEFIDNCAIIICDFD